MSLRSIPVRQLAVRVQLLMMSKQRVSVPLVLSLVEAPTEVFQRVVFLLELESSVLQSQPYLADSFSHPLRLHPAACGTWCDPLIRASKYLDRIRLSLASGELDCPAPAPVASSSVPSPQAHGRRPRRPKGIATRTVRTSSRPPRMCDALRVLWATRRTCSEQSRDYAHSDSSAVLATSVRAASIRLSQ